MPHSSTKWSVVLLCTTVAGFGLYSSRAKESIAMDRCLDAGGAYEKSWKICDKTTIEAPDMRFSGPVFAGILDGNKVSLQLRDDQLAYRMIANGLRMVGDLNTERGFQTDDQAVVYVLDWLRDDADQMRFVQVFVNGAQELQRIGPDQKIQADAALRAK